MRDIQDSPRIIVQRVLQDFLAGDVQMVGGLVQDQEIGLGEHQLRQGHPAALAAGEHFDLLEHVLSGEQEGRQDVADLRIRERRIFVRDFFKNGFIRMQHMVLLVVVADLNLASDADLSGVRVHQTVDDL